MKTKKQKTLTYAQKKALSLKSLKGYYHGNTRQVLASKGTETSDGLASMAGSLKAALIHALNYGTPSDKKYLIHVDKVAIERGWIRMVFTNARIPIAAKNYIKKWAIKNNFLFYDKSFKWSTNTASSEKCSLGPWSCHPCLHVQNAGKQQLLVKRY